MLLQLQISKFQFFSADALVASDAALRTLEDKILHVKLHFAIIAAMTARTHLNL